MLSSTHPIQVAWTSRNAGSVQNRTVSASYVTCIPRGDTLYSPIVQDLQHVGSSQWDDWGEQ